MYLEGCQAKLGCSIVISGPEMDELRQVRHALKACLKTARILLLEREIFRFFVPEIENFKREVPPEEESKGEDGEEMSFSSGPAAGNTLAVSATPNSDKNGDSRNSLMPNRQEEDLY